MGGCFSYCGQVQADAEDWKQWVDKEKIKKEWDRQFQQAEHFQINKPLVVLSDMHLGNGDEKTDAFMGVKKTWMKAMTDFYLPENFVLLELGDIEDRWLFSFHDIIKAHSDVFLVRQKFFLKDRLIKLIGNHDDVYYDEETVSKELHPWFPNLRIFDSIRVNDQFFFLHGHQGTYERGTTSKCSACCLSCCWVPCLQCCNSQKKSYQTPSTNTEMYYALDKIAHEWITENKTNTILGHTHHPVVHETETKGCVKTDNLYYFNTGCCMNNDGSFTALEIYADRILLVRWKDSKREVLETTWQLGKSLAKK
jgi:UDP-2,3-diacylglucosamine pyrophosphatase LpxH